MIQLSNVSVLVNDQVIPIVANSLKFSEGKGEQTVRVASLGGDAVEQVYAQDLESAFGKVMFEMHTTIDNVNSQRQWQSNQNRNVVALAAGTDDGNFNRVYTQCAMVNDPEIEIGNEGMISVEFSGNAPS